MPPHPVARSATNTRGLRDLRQRIARMSQRERARVLVNAC